MLIFYPYADNNDKYTCIKELVTESEHKFSIVT